MYSRFAAVISAFMLSALMTACSSPFNDRNPTEQTVTLNSSSQQCLSDAAGIIGRYFDGKSNEAEISGFWDCTNQSLDMFMSHTKGSVEGKYSAEELRRFMHRFFLGSHKISDELLAEGMKLKVAILGGELDTLTVDEIKATQKIVSVLKQESVSLLKFQPIRPSHYTAAGSESVDQMVVALEASASNIGKVVSESASEYKLINLKRFLMYFNAFLERGGVQIPEIRTMVELMPFIMQMKNLLVSRPADMIASNDWTKVLQVGTSWYGWVMKFVSLNKYDRWMWGTGLKRFSKVLGDALVLLKKSFSTWSEETIPFEELDMVIDSMGDKYIREWVLSSVAGQDSETTILKRVIRPFVQKAFSAGHVDSKGRNAVGLTYVALERVFDEFKFYTKAQQFVEAVFDARAGGKFNPDVDFAATYGEGQLIGSASKILSTITDKQGIDAANDVINLISYMRPLFKGSSPYVNFDSKKYNDRSHSFYNLFQMNWIRMISRLAIKSYVGDKVANCVRDEKTKTCVSEPSDEQVREMIRQRIHLGYGEYGGLTEDETHQLYMDFYDVGVALKFFNKNSKDAAKKRFLEANLFSFAADGGKTLSHDELTQLFAFLISAKKRSNEIHSTLIDLCDAKGNPNDQYGNPVIDPLCYRIHLFGKQPQEWSDVEPEKIPPRFRPKHGCVMCTGLQSNMKELANFYNDLNNDDPEHARTFDNYLMYAAIGPYAFNNSVKDHDDKTKLKLYYDTDDTDSIITLLHYVEAMFANYDEVEPLDVLQKKESDNAFKVFEGELRELSPFKRQKPLKKLFRFLLKFGRAPQAGCWKDSIKFLGWWVVEPYRKVHADRVVMLKILSELQNQDAERGCKRKGDLVPPKFAVPSDGSFNVDGMVGP